MIERRSNQHLSRRDFLKESLGFAGAALFLNSLDTRGLTEELRNSSEGSEFRFPENEFRFDQFEQVVVPNGNLEILLFPLTHEFDFNFWANKREQIPSKVTSVKLGKIPMLQRNLYYENNGDNVYSILPYSLTKQKLPVAIMETEKGKNYSASETKYRSLYTLLSDFYPNKIINILIGLEKIDEFQQQNGGFKEGEEYSFLKLSGLKSSLRDYLHGKNAAGETVRGGGICALATSLCRTMILDNADIVERWEHRSGLKYPSNPFSGVKMSERNSDATVDLSHDFRFKVNKGGYLKINAEIVPNGTVAKEFGTKDRPSDAFLALSLGMVDEPVSEQGSELRKTIQQYLNYRSGQGSLVTGVKEIPWGVDSDMSRVVEGIYSDQDIKDFKEEILGSKFLQDLFEVKDLVNKFANYNVDYGLGRYLSNTEWYKRQVERISSYPGTDLLKDFTVTVLDTIEGQTYETPGERLQCIGYAALVGAMHDPSLLAVNIGNTPVTKASAIIPDAFRDNPIHSMVHPTGNYVVYSTENIANVTKGSLFVKTGPLGHVGVVLCNKVVNGKNKLLCTDANSQRDGRIRFFTVDENNWDNKFGPYPIKKYFVQPTRR